VIKSGLFCYLAAHFIDSLHMQICKNMHLNKIFDPGYQIIDIADFEIFTRYEYEFQALNAHSTIEITRNTYRRSKIYLQKTNRECKKTPLIPLITSVHFH